MSVFSGWSPAPAVAAGLILGLLAGLVNYRLAMAGLGRDRQVPPARMNHGVFLIYGARYAIDLAVLFVSYRNAYMLVAAVLGLSLALVGFVLRLGGKPAARREGE